MPALKPETFTRIAKFAVGACFNPAGIPEKAAEQAVDLIATWLPTRERSRYEQLVGRVSGELARLAEVEFGGKAALAPAVTLAEVLFRRDGLDGPDLMRLGYDPEEADEELLRRGRDLLGREGDAVAGFCRRIVAGVHGALLADPGVVQELEPAFRRAVLGQLARLDAAVAGLPAEVAAELRRQAGSALLIDPVRRWRPELLAPSALLQAEFAVVGFEERPALTDDLLAWCEGGAEVGVRLYTGAGGCGKTRLMMEMCRRLGRRGWRAGFLAVEAAEAPNWALPALLDRGGDRFIVVDEAPTRRKELTALLDLAADGAGGGKLRLVLLARGGADWWRELAHAGGMVGALLKGPATGEPIEVGAIAGGAADRRRVFDRALAAFAARLGRAEEAAAPAPDLTAEPFDSVLFIHMAAFAALEGRTIEWADELLEAALDRERKAWREGLEARGLAGLGVEAVGQAATLVTLAGGAADRGEADGIIAPAPLLGGQPDAARNQVLDLLRSLYPAERYLEGVQPDLLGEEIVNAALRDDSRLLDAAFVAGPSDERIGHALTVLTRLAQRRPEAGRWLERVFAGHLDRASEPAIAVAVETGDPIGELLADAVERQPVAGPGNLDRGYRLMALLPAQTVALRRLRVVVTEQCLDGLRADPEPDERRQAAIAVIANNLSVYRGDLGRREEALDAAGEAVAIRRELAAARPDAFRPDLAMALNNLANRLSALGRREEALDAAREAAGLYRELAAARPDAFRPDLAGALNNLANCFSDLGRREEALDAAREAAAIRRELAAARPDAFRPNLAVSLYNLAIHLDAGQRAEEALAANREAVEALSAPFCALPRAFAHWMGPMMQGYMERCEKLGREPDGELLAPIVEVFQRLQGEPGEGGPG